MRILPLDPLPADGVVPLEGEDAEHLVRVLRVRAGEDFVVQDRAGNRRAATVAKVERQRVHLELGAALPRFPSKACPLWVAAALPKGKRLTQMVQGGTEAGWDRFFPTHFARSVRRVESDAVERIERWMHEAVKQCGAPPAQTVAPPGLAAELPAPPEVERVVFDPGASASWPRLQGELRTDRPWLLVFGPEGGFEEEELEALGAAPSRRAHLGPQVLRIETAVVVATAAAAQTLWSRED